MWRSQSAGESTRQTTGLMELYLNIRRLQFDQQEALQETEHPAHLLRQLIGQFVASQGCYHGNLTQHKETNEPQ